MMKKSIRGSTCLGHLEKFKTLLPSKDVLEGANNTLKPANILLVIDGLDMYQEYLKSTKSYVDHCILKPWNDRQDMFITCIPTSESDTVNGLDILSAISALCYEIDDMACLEEIADQYQDHAGIGYLMSNLGVMFSEKMEYKKSETCFARAKNCFEREHDHLGNAVASLNLAILHKLNGNDESAQVWCDSAASLCHDISMRMTRDVLLPWKVLRRLADLFQEFGNYKRCQDVLQIGVLYDISGADEAPTITLMKRLMALQLKEQNGEKIQGEELEGVSSQFLEFLDRLCTDIGVKQELLNADLITTAIILAKMYRDINCIEEACVLLGKLLDKYLLVHGRNHRLHASLLYHVGRFKLGVGKTGEAETMLKQSLEGFIYYFGKGHHTVASCKSLLGTCALLQGHSRDASIFLTEALTLFKKINLRHPDVAEILLKFAYLYNEEGNFQSAKKTMQEALDIFNSACGEDSPKTASAYIEAAAFSQKVRESRASAADKVKKAIDIFLKLGLQRDHPDVMICRSLLGVLQVNIGSDEAEEQFTEVLRQVSLLEESFMASEIISPEITNMFFQVKTSSDAERYSCFGTTVVSLANLVNMKGGNERRAHLNTLLSFLPGHETEMPLFAGFAGQNYIFHKIWLSDRYVYCVLTDQGVNSDFTSLNSNGLEDPNVFLLSSSTSHGKKPCYLLFWKTRKVLEMREPSRVCSAFRESVNMLFLQPKFRKGYVGGQDFYMELAMPTEPSAVTSLYSQIDYLPLLVEQELSVSHKDGNIDTALHPSVISAAKPSTHVSYFLYTFSSQRQAEFVFDNLMCSLGQSLALVKVEGVAICDASNVQNGECFFILEPNNSSLSLVVEEESVLVKCRTVKESESSCICSSVKSTLESTLDLMCSAVKVTFEQSLQLFCDDHYVGSNCIRESAKRPHCSGHSSETLELRGAARSQELECDHLEGEPPADLLQNEVAEHIFTGQPGDKITTEVCLGLLECLLTSRHLSSEVQPSATGEMSSSTYSAYLNDEKQLNNSMLSPGPMSSLNSCPTSPSNEVCQMPVFSQNMSASVNKGVGEPCHEKKDPNNDDSCMTGNTSVACAGCSESSLTLQEKLSNQFVGDCCVRDSSARRSSHEGVSSGENNQDTKTRDIVQLEDGTQLSKEDILILKSEVEFCQNQCHELRQQLGQLKAQFQQCEEEKQQLELELGRRSFLEDKQKRYERAFLSSRAHANQQIKSCSASGASYDFTGMEGKLLGGAGLLQDQGFSLQQRLLEISNSLSDVELRQMKSLVKPRVDAFRLAKIREGFELFEELDANGGLSRTYVRKLLQGIQRFDLVEKLNVPLLGDAERVSHPPPGQTTSDRTTESPVIPPRENSPDLLPENPSQNSSGDNLLQLQSSYEEGLASAGDSVTKIRETDAQYMPQLCHPTDGELRDGVDSLHQNNIRKSDSERKRRFLSAKSNDDVVRLITTAAERDSQEQIEWLQRELQEYEAENQILQAELKRATLPRAEDLPSGACSLPETSTGSHPATGQNMLEKITKLPVIPLKDSNQDQQQVGCDETLDGMLIQDNEGLSRINEASPASPDMSCKDSLNSGSDMVVLPMNSDSEDSSVHPHLPDCSNGVSFSNESSSATVSSSELSSAAESMRVESTSSSCMAHSACDSSPRVTLDQLSAVKNRERFSDTSSYNPNSSEEEMLEITVSKECERGDMDRREDYAAKNEEIGQVSESTGYVSDGPGKPPHLKMKGAASDAKDVVDCGPRSPDRVQERARSQHVPGLMQDVFPDGDISVEQNASVAFSGGKMDTTVEQLVSDVSTQSKQWEHLGARPRDRPPVKMPPLPEPSLIDLVPQEVTVASGLANAFLARHSQDQSLHESLCQVKLLSGESSSQGASYMDGMKHSGEPNKAKPYLGDCQVVPRPDVDSGWMLPPPVPGRGYDSYNAVGGYAYNTRLNTPLSSFLTGGTGNFPSSSAVNSSNDNLFRSDFALSAREPYLPFYGQLDPGLNTSVPGDQRLHSGMTVSHLANGSLMGAAGPQLTPPVHVLQRYYSGPSDNASTVVSKREKTNSAWKANSRQTSVGNMARVDAGSSGLPAPSIVKRSNGADNRHVSEAESRRTSQYEQGTGSSNVLNTCGDRVVSGANRDVDNTHSEAALLSAGSRDTRLVASGNEHLNLEPVGAEASFISANTGGAMLNRDFGTDSVESTDNSLLALEQRVEEACALVERVLREREEREQFGKEIERKEREIREQRARKKREREAREQEEASRWPRQQEPITEGLQTSASLKDLWLVTMEEKVTEACTVGERLLKEQEDQTKRQTEVVQRQGEIREDREIRERAEREARERGDMAVAELAPARESPQWQCEHFKRRCSVRFPCCGVFYPCHYCHNGSGVCDSSNKANQATHIKCANCGHKEEINEGSQTCSSCGTRLSEYFCFKCKHFTGVDKNPFHCNKCGICRIHKDRAFHCDVCNVCLDKRLEGKHKYRPFSQQDKHLICLQENQGQEGDPLEDQRALQTRRIVDAVPGDGQAVDSDNESNPEFESSSNEEDLSAKRDDTVLRLLAAAAPESREQISHLENAVQELKKENQTLKALLEKASSRGDIADLPGMSAVCDDSSTHLSVPAYRHFNVGVATNVALEPSLVDEVQGIDAVFLARHSQDPHLCESLQANVLEAGPNMVAFSEPSLVNEVQGIDTIFLEQHSRDPDLCESPQVNAENISLLEAGPNMVSSSEDPVSRQWIRNPGCLVPSENDCDCCKNDGSQACGVYDTIMPQRRRPDSGHDVCCQCLEDVLSGSLILPCSHRIHMECIVGMIPNWQLTCPICGRPFLWRG